MSAPQSALTPRADPLAGYEDWPVAARSAAAWAGPTADSTSLGAVLGLRELPERPTVTEEDSRTIDGVDVSRLRWSVGYGPDSIGWLLRPSGVHDQLPGVLGMHCHGGIRSVGGEQLVDLGDDASSRARSMRAGAYDGRATANDLARQGFAVLVHDTFSWGSRAFDLSDPTPKLAALIAGQEARWRELGAEPTAEDRFDFASGWHEDTVAKAAGTLGQTFAGLVLTDDLVALDVLAGMPGTDSARLGTFGFSGGGGRSLLLAALDHRISAAVVCCMMATFASLVPDYLDAHSWLLHVPGLWPFADWPDLTALARSRWLVEYREDDALFSPGGMRAADRRLRELHGDDYQRMFTPGPHGFGAVEQDAAWSFLRRSLYDE